MPPPGPPPFCNKPWVGFEVEHDGTVRPCCMAKKGCGNVLEASIHDIWNGPSYREFRQAIAEGRWQETCRPECPRLYGVVPDSQPVAQTEQFSQNYQRNLAEIERRALTLSSWPRFWKVTHSTLCNLDCIMCYQDRDDLQSLPEIFYQQMEMLHHAAQEIQVLGGEPFAIRRLRDFLSSFDKTLYPDARFSFVTNGTVHDAKTIDLVRGLNVSWMTISLDAATPETYARIRKKGDFALTMAGVHKWIELGRENGFTVTLAFTLMKDNAAEMPMFIQLASDLGVDCLIGSLIGVKGGQQEITERRLRDSLAQSRAVIQRGPFPMPLAELTLDSVSPDLHLGSHPPAGPLVTIAPAQPA